MNETSDSLVILGSSERVRFYIQNEIQKSKFYVFNNMFPMSHTVYLS